MTSLCQKLRHDLLLPLRFLICFVMLRFSGRCTEVVVCQINPLAKVTEITLNASSSLSLDCVVVSSHPVQTIKWVKDERVLKIDTGTHRVSTLSLYNVTVEDVGTYCCIAGIGNREGSCEISVHINGECQVIPSLYAHFQLTGLALLHPPKPPLHPLLNPLSNPH